MNWSRKWAEAGPYHRKVPFFFLESTVGPHLIDIIVTVLYYSSDESQNLILGFSRDRAKCTHPTTEALSWEV